MGWERTGCTVYVEPYADVVRDEAPWHGYTDKELDATACAGPHTKGVVFTEGAKGGLGKDAMYSVRGGVRERGAEMRRHGA